ncbi:glycerophosphoryl diester phosphodiesterase membrane domain-containing protein [Streptomyces sp. PR69]|uniref:DUF7847 domain-containing protein n=1 Tax=Streptomyces sp. PR69 TaxID=2984950 RepID=UPI0022647DE7|nr:glycerophosphoryl diester phosphodiesterase membrane domain-containing protein [Streptomyces sp. PR69]
MIPLGPLGMGDIYGGAFATMGRCWKQLFGMALAVYGGAAALFAGVVALAYAAVSEHVDVLVNTSAYEEPPWEDIRPLIVAFVCVWLIGVAVMVLAQALLSAACPAVLQDAVIGRRVIFGAVWRRAWGRLPSVLGAVLLGNLTVFAVPFLLYATGFVLLMAGAATQSGATAAWALLPLLLLAAVPLSVWLWVKFLFAPTVAVLERQSPVAALRRSSQLVRGDWWRIFGISLLAAIMAAVAAYIIQLPFSFATLLPGASVDPDASPAQALAAMAVGLITFAIGSLIGQIAAAIFPQLVNSLLYVDQRIRKENLAPALAQAAQEVQAPHGAQHEPAG